MLSTNTIKPRLDDAPRKKRVILSKDVKVGGAFNFDGGQYFGSKKRAPKQGVIFTDQLRFIAEAKTRAARVADVAKAKALKAVTPKKAVPKGRAKKGKR